MKIETGVQYVCNNGGTVTIIADSENIYQTGVDNGMAFWGDVYIDAYNDMSLDLTAERTRMTLEYESEEPVLELYLSSRGQRGRADIEFHNVNPEAWYRMLFDGELTEVRRGSSIEKSTATADEDVIVTFDEAVIPQ